MSNRVLVKLTYNRKILIDVKDLPKLMEILDGATMVDYNWVGEDRVDYVTEKAFELEFENAPKICYVTYQQYLDADKAYKEVGVAEEAEVAEDA